VRDPAPSSQNDPPVPDEPQNSLLSATGTTIFTVMSALAVRHGAINLGRASRTTTARRTSSTRPRPALLDGRNQYPPLTGLPELRAAVAAHNRRFYGIEADPGPRSSSPPARRRRSPPA
jgi:aspartate/methionine/tyrosine aminotransferase